MAAQPDSRINTNERITGVPGREMLKRSGILQSQDEADILDLACGGGIITSDILQAASQSSNLKINRIIAGDIDDNMLSFVTRKRDATGPDPLWSRVEAQRMNQNSIPQPENTFTHVFNNFGVFFESNEAATLAETLRVLKSDGVAGFTSWKSIAWWDEAAMPALAQYLSEAPKLPSGGVLFSKSGWSDLNGTPAKLEKAGFRDAKATEFTFTPGVEAEPFADATAFLVQSIARRMWSEEDYGKFQGGIEPALLRYLEEHYKDGVWDGKMTAIMTLGAK